MDLKPSIALQDNSAFEAVVGMSPLALEAIPDAIYVVDLNGRILRYNSRAADLWGRAPRIDDPSDLHCGSVAAFDMAGKPLSLPDTPIGRALKTGEPVRDAQVQIERPDGERRILLVNVDPLTDKSGRVRGAISSFIDITDRHRIESEIRESRQDLEDFFENSAVGLHIVNNEGVIVRANRAELDLLGYAPDEYIGRNIADFHVDQPVIADILTRLSCGQGLDKQPARLRARDGSIKEVLITSNARFLEGNFLSTRCFTVDVTEQRVAARARREAEERLAATYANAAVGITETDASGRHMRVNDAFVDLTGYSRDELLSMRFADLTLPDDRDRSEELYARQRSGEVDRYSIEKRYLRKDGRVIDVEISGSAVRDENGSFRFGVRVVRDVTDEKRSARLLEQSERLHRELLQAMPMAVYTTDAEGRITFFNEAAATLAGRKPTLGDDSWCVTWKLYWPDGTFLPHDQCPMAMAIREKRAILGELEAIAERPDGSRVPFMPYASPLFDPNGQLVGAVNILVDITERKRSEERQKLLIDELNHRVKNTLATVQSIAAQTIKSAAEPQAFRKAFEGRLAALSRAHDLLTHSRWEGASIMDVMQAAFTPFGNSRVALKGSEAMLRPTGVLSLGMVLHELATNASKYGALSNADGRVAVTWGVETDLERPSLRIVWEEIGGPPVDVPKRTGFGTQLIERSVTRELGGEASVEYRPEGLVCRLAMPMQ